MCSGTPTPDNHEITTHTMQRHASWTFPFVLVDLLFSAQHYDTEHTHGITSEGRPFARAVSGGGSSRDCDSGIRQQSLKIMFLDRDLSILL